MKKITFILVFILLIWCEKFPSNLPSGSVQTNNVFIEHVGTEYVSTEPPGNLLTATKVNVLFFKIRAEHFTPSSIEIYGRALIQGPPESREQSIHYRTDSIVLNPEGTNYTFNTLQTIQADSTYILVRPKFPTNEYSPFQGTQGMIEEISITEVWAYDAAGERIAVNFEYVH